MNNIFIETIRLTAEGVNYLSYHQKRVDKTLKDHNLPCLELKDLLHNLPKPPSPLCRCRVVYGQVKPKIELLPYSPIIRKRVKIEINNTIDYSYKYLDREELNKILHNSVYQDAIIIKNNMVTDSCFANLVFENKEGLFTPSSPLLRGTERQRLIDEKIISEKAIFLSDIKEFDFVYFINAMMPLGFASAFVVTELEKP
ncbi:MAG: aminotransferase class IV [Bacteroidota bacterium]|nr:aminotransferase class IV [Bacteroidota bacterium]